MNILKLLTTLSLITVLACQNQNYAPIQETEEEHDARMEWWREARFGLFIHWGLYAVPAGEWESGTNHAEWIRTTAQIPLETYDQFLNDFNPTKFNAESWVSMAKDAGMKYIVITSKHHDGFCLWNSKYTDFDIMSTPFKRDIMQELSDACAKEGIKMCWYHSIMDWHHPDYLPRRGWENDRTTSGAEFDRYVTYMKKQLKELLSKYGDIGVLWFDGEWESTWTSEYGTDLYHYVRNLQPDILVNNRVGVGRSGMAGLTEEGEFGGDFGTPEQTIPATGLPDVDWETCMTMNRHWGYNRLDKDFKSSTDLIQKLADIVSKGGNFLLNVGPTAEGLFPQESVDRLRDIGVWMKTNGESIYGTLASPFSQLEWGRCTQKPMEESTRLYFHIFDWPENGKLTIPGLGSELIRAYLLADPQQDELKMEKDRDAVVIYLPDDQPNVANSVVIVDIVGEPIIYEAPSISAHNRSFIDQLEVTISKKEAQTTLRYTIDGTLPTLESTEYKTPFLITNSTTISAACFDDQGPVSSTTQEAFIQVEPKPGKSLSSLKSGLLYYYYHGEWDKIPEFNGLSSKQQGVASSFELAKETTQENFAIDYQGFITITSDDVYTFYLSSDDGSRLYINEEIIIDHDGLHSASVKKADIALGKGLHAIRISFFEKTGGNTLELEWSSTQFEKQAIPFEKLQHRR